ncbi:MAG: hypothetical protein NTV20_00290, partial [Candidatus Shapirobacteria bacterium]|nr:hypothetical protein [Candidatus Shapirobacteria bacterium]
IAAAFLVTFYLYQRGKITIFPSKKEKVINNNLAAQIPISNKEYKIFYKDKIDPTFDIANFENNEDWYGDGEFDYSTFLEGESSLFLTSLNGQKATITLKKNFDIENVLNFKFLVYLAGDPADIEELNLVFTGQNIEYKFPIRDLVKGWNFLVLPKDKFSFFSPQTDGKKLSSIEKIVVELTSRPQARTIINLDSLWAEKEKDYSKDWNSNSEKFLSLKRNGNSAGLLAIGLYGNRATLSKGSAKDYTFQAKFNSLRGGEFGLFLRGDYESGYGYYLMMGGVNTNTWRIYKNGLFEEKNQALDLAKGEISNFKMEKNRSYWLKVELKGPRLIFYLSVDGQNFIKLGEANDTSFTSGGVGFVISGSDMVLVDEAVFFQ